MKIVAVGNEYAVRIAPYALYVLIVWLFDYAYMPWLAIRFEYIMFVPLYFSIFIVCYGGVYLYEFIGRDIFFINKIQAWLLTKEGSSRISETIRQLINRNPENTFIAISIWWSPFHAYLFSRKSEKTKSAEVARMLAKGSLYCALFWGVILEALLLAWRVFKQFI